MARESKIGRFLLITLVTAVALIFLDANTTFAIEENWSGCEKPTHVYHKFASDKVPEHSVSGNVSLTLLRINWDSEEFDRQKSPYNFCLRVSHQFPEEIQRLNDFSIICALSGDRTIELPKGSSPWVYQRTLSKIMGIAGAQFFYMQTDPEKDGFFPDNVILVPRGTLRNPRFIDFQASYLRRNDGFQYLWTEEQGFVVYFIKPHVNPDGSTPSVCEIVSKLKTLGIQVMPYLSGVSKGVTN